MSPCLFHFYAEYILRNAGLDEAQTVIKIAGRNVSNPDIQMTPHLWQKMKIMASSPLTSCEIDGGTAETVSELILGGSKITADGDCSHEIKDAYSLERKL